MRELDEYLSPTFYLNSDDPAVEETAREVAGRKHGPVEKAVALFYYVRDTVKYRIIFDIPGKHYFRASDTLARGEGFCMPKAVLLAAMARSQGIPARLHVANIINHTVPDYIERRLETKLMTYHTYVEFHLDDRWVKATPSFDLGTCVRHGFRPVDFDGKSDAMLLERDKIGRQHIEYTADFGTRADFPLAEVIKAFGKEYPHIPSLTDNIENEADAPR